MAEFLELVGGRPLRGTIQAGGAKNAALPLLIATLLTSERCTLANVPNLHDITLTLHLLETFGADVDYHHARISTAVPNLVATEASYSLVKALRASFWVLAPLLARGRAARVALPGGDIIGARPVDMHLAALTQMGAEITMKHGVVFATAPRGLKPATIDFRFPSVGATHQVLMAAALTPGTTVIKGAAREPEVVALCRMLRDMGADIEGEGTSEIVVRGAESLSGTHVDLIGDRIEAGTYLLAGVATRGNVTVTGVDPTFFGEFLNILDAMNVSVATDVDSISISCPYEPHPVKVSTAPFPLLATDLQAPLMAALATIPGESVIEEHVFEGRFGNVSELCRMGAAITVTEQIATIHGVERLTGAEVEGRDIRAAASLVVAGLAAEGVTTISEIYHLRRGYEHLEAKIEALGSHVGWKIADAEDFMFTGC